MNVEQRSELLWAITDCEHSMTDGRVTLHFDRSKPGNNALHQLTNRIEAALASPAAEPVQATPSSRWRVEGEPDPHAGHYDGERAALTLGYLTDDELANGAFMNYDRRLDLGAIGKPGYHSPIAWMTAVKDRIRWLSRALDRALASPPATKEAKAGWVPTSERLPKPGDAVLGFYPSVRASGYWNYATVAYLPGDSTHGWCNPEDEDDEFVPPDFWMPLPPAPEGAA